MDSYESSELNAILSNIIKLEKKIMIVIEAYATKRSRPYVI